MIKEGLAGTHIKDFDFEMDEISLKIIL